MAGRTICSRTNAAGRWQLLKPSAFPSTRTQRKSKRDYALSLGAPFVLLSNGREHYFGEYDTGDARPVVGFSSRADLERRANLRQHRAASLQHSLNALPLPTRFRFQGEVLTRQFREPGKRSIFTELAMAGRDEHSV
jgi:hypothetical protein